MKRIKDNESQKENILQKNKICSQNAQMPDDTLHVTRGINNMKSRRKRKESVLERKGHKYLVRWDTYPIDEDTWELRSAIPSKILQIYEKSLEEMNLYVKQQQTQNKLNKIQKKSRTKIKEIRKELISSKQRKNIKDIIKHMKNSHKQESGKRKVSKKKGKINENKMLQNEHSYNKIFDNKEISLKNKKMLNTKFEKNVLPTKKNRRRGIRAFQHEKWSTDINERSQGPLKINTCHISKQENIIMSNQESNVNPEKDEKIEQDESFHQECVYMVYSGELFGLISPKTPTQPFTVKEDPTVYSSSSSKNDEEVSRVLALERLLEERLNTKLPVT